MAPWTTTGFIKSFTYESWRKVLYILGRMDIINIENVDIDTKGEIMAIMSYWALTYRYSDIGSLSSMSEHTVF